MTSISGQSPVDRLNSLLVPAPTLRVNALWALLGQIAYAAAQCLMLIALAKLGDPAIVGQFSLAFAVAAPIFMFCNLQLRNLLGTDTKGQYRFADYLGLQILTATVGLGLTWIAVRALGYSGPTESVILVVGLAKAFESVTEICMGLFQKAEEMSLVGRSLVLRGALSVAGLTTGLWLGRDALSAVLGLLVVWAFMALAIDLPLASRLHAGAIRSFAALCDWRSWVPIVRPEFVVKQLLSLAWLGLPLGAVNLLISLHASMPRYLIEGRMGIRELGIFSAMSYVALLGNPVVQALGNTVSPRLAREYAAGRRTAFCRLLLKTIAYGALFNAACVLICAVAGRPILSILFGPEYAVHADVFPWIIFGVGLAQIAQLMTYGATASRSLRSQIPLFGAAVLTIGVLGVWLIPMGLVGAAIAIIVSGAVLILGNTIVLWRAIRGMRPVSC